MKKRKNIIPVIMITVLLLSMLCAALCAYMYTKSEHEVILHIGIIAGTVAAHTLIMYISAPVVFLVFKKNFKYDSFWFRPKRFEKSLYNLLKVKKWKTRVPVYDSDEYSMETHTAKEIIMNTCHAEVVHEVILVASYLPILGGLAVSHWALLAVTSFLFSCCHLMFVVIQRYNRPRLVRLYERQRAR